MGSSAWLNREYFLELGKWWNVPEQGEAKHPSLGGKSYVPGGRQTLAWLAKAPFVPLFKTHCMFGQRL